MSIPPNFVLISEVLPVQRRDFYVANTDLLNPINANPIVDGEWLDLNGSYQLERGTTARPGPTWPVFAERGRYDTQAIGKTTVLFGGFFEAETRVVNTSSLVVGSPLRVTDVTVDALTKKGLALATGSGQHWVVGFVTRMTGGGKVRFWYNGGSQIHIP
jgi:hypothetical protein